MAVSLSLLLWSTLKRNFSPISHFSAGYFRILAFLADKPILGTKARKFTRSYLEALFSLIFFKFSLILALEAVQFSTSINLYFVPLNQNRENQNTVLISTIRSSKQCSTNFCEIIKKNIILISSNEKLSSFSNPYTNPAMRGGTSFEICWDIS